MLYLKEKQTTYNKKKDSISIAGYDGGMGRKYFCFQILSLPRSLSLHVWLTTFPDVASCFKYFQATLFGFRLLHLK